MRAMRGKTLETVPFQPYFGCTKSFLKVLPSNESYERKMGCNRTLATVLWVPLIFDMGQKVGFTNCVFAKLCFSQFWGLVWGGLFLFIWGLEGLGVFVFLVFVFVFLCRFCFCFVCFVLVLLLDCFWRCFLFCFCFFLFFFVFVLAFCFLGRVWGSGEVAQWATSLGPKPSFFSFCFCCFLLLFCFPLF